MIHTPQAAGLAARREFGNRTLIQEVTREMWGWNLLETLWQYLRYAVTPASGRSCGAGASRADESVHPTGSHSFFLFPTATEAATMIPNATKTSPATIPW